MKKEKEEEGMHVVSAFIFAFIASTLALRKLMLRVDARSRFYEDALVTRF